MNIDDRKGKILDNAVRLRNPYKVLELGNYFVFRSYLRNVL